MTECPIARRDPLRARRAGGVGRLWTGDCVSPVDAFGLFDTAETSVRASNGEGTIAPSFVNLDEAGGPVSCDRAGSGPLSEEDSPFVDGDESTAVYSPEVTPGDATEQVPVGADSTIEVVS